MAKSLAIVLAFAALVGAAHASEQQRIGAVVIPGQHHSIT